MLDLILAGALETWWVIVLPVCAGAILTLLEAAATRRRLRNKTSIDVGLDMTFLAAGASGGALAKPSVSLFMQGILPLFVAVFLVIVVGNTAFFLYQKSQLTRATVVSDARRNLNLLLAALVCGLVAVVAFLEGMAEVVRPCL